MSGKFSKKNNKSSAETGKKGGNRLGLILALILLAAAALVLVFLLLRPSFGGQETPTETAAPSEDQTQPSLEETVSIQQVENVSIDLGNGLMITDIGKYTGAYMEDGSDEVVSGVLMIMVTNSSGQDIQYAKITLTAPGGQTAEFDLSTLPAGMSAVVLESSRQLFDAAVAYDEAALANLALYSAPLSLHEDVLTIQTVGGAMNITNISGEDITGDIIIYYKNSSADMLYGGITYRVRIEGGLKAGEIRQIMPSHFSEQGSRIMFVTVG